MGAGSKSSRDANASDFEDVPHELSSSSSTTISAHGTATRSSVGKNVTGKKPFPIPRQDMPTLSRRLDYRLVPLDEPPRRGNEVHLSGSQAGQILLPESMVRTPYLRNTSVWVATALSGPVMGSLLRCPRFIKMAGWPTFEEVWVVKLEKPSCKFSKLLFDPNSHIVNLTLLSTRRLRSMGPRCGHRRPVRSYHR